MSEDDQVAKLLSSLDDDPLLSGEFKDEDGN